MKAQRKIIESDEELEEKKGLAKVLSGDFPVVQLIDEPAPKKAEKKKIKLKKKLTKKLKKKLKEKKHAGKAADEAFPKVRTSSVERLVSLEEVPQKKQLKA